MIFISFIKYVLEPLGAILLSFDVYPSLPQFEAISLLGRRSHSRESKPSYFKPQSLTLLIIRQALLKEEGVQLGLREKEGIEPS